MRSIIVSSPDNNEPFRYPIHIGNGIAEKIEEFVKFSEFTSVVLVSDKAIKKTLLSVPQLKITGDESCKTLASVSEIWSFFKEHKLDRDSLVFSFGGGALGDAVGFAASTYMRGIKFAHIPTTLVSQVDASIGGKVGINFAGIKNLIGTFHHPNAVIIDPELLKTLPKREFNSGFAEIIKHGLIKDREYFETLTGNAPLEDLIARSCKIKCDIVSEDPYEKGLRKLLNFGHTVGHALEAIALEEKIPLLHGEAVALGIIVETTLSINKGLADKKILEIVQASLEGCSLPIKSPFTFSEKLLIEKMLSDKKNFKGSIRAVLLKGIGEAIYDIEITPAEISKALSIIKND